MMLVLDDAYKHNQICGFILMIFVRCPAQNMECPAQNMECPRSESDHPEDPVLVDAEIDKIKDFPAYTDELFVILFPVIGPGFIRTNQGKKEFLAEHLPGDKILEISKGPDLFQLRNVGQKVVPQGDYASCVVPGGKVVIIELVGLLETLGEKVEHHRIQVTGLGIAFVTGFLCAGNVELDKIQILVMVEC
jgi:hypothetical protein